MCEGHSRLGQGEGWGAQSRRAPSGKNLRALGRAPSPWQRGAELIAAYPATWKEHLLDLNAIDWRKVNPQWENICIIANSVVSNRQARFATKAFLKKQLGLPLNEAEDRAIAASAAVELPEVAE